MTSAGFTRSGPVAAAMLGLLLAVLAHAGPSRAAAPEPERRVALVIGNGAYPTAPPLANPPTDARKLAAALRGLGFEVLEAEDQDQPDMLARLDEFAARLEGARL